MRISNILTVHNPSRPLINIFEIYPCYWIRQIAIIDVHSTVIKTVIFVVSDIAGVAGLRDSAFKVCTAL